MPRLPRVLTERESEIKADDELMERHLQRASTNEHQSKRNTTSHGLSCSNLRTGRSDPDQPK